MFGIFKNEYNSKSSVLAIKIQEKQDFSIRCKSFIKDNIDFRCKKAGIKSINQKDDVCFNCNGLLTLLDGKIVSCCHCSGYERNEA